MLRGVPEDEVNATGPAKIAVTDSPIASPVPPPPLLQMPGDFPKSGGGKYVIGKTGGPILGTAGSLKRFRIAIESEAAAAEI